MTFLLLLLAALLVLDVPSAHAEPIPIFQVTDATMFMRPNVAGDNISFAFTGPGVDVRGVGGMGCFAWCSGAPVPPGVGFDLTQIFISNFATAIVGGVAYDPNTEIGVSSPSFFDAAGGLNPIAMGFIGSGPTFSEFRMTLPTNGGWTLNFAPATDQNGNSTVAFVNGTFSASAPSPTPEPGTLGLMLVASVGAGWIIRRRRPAVPTRECASD